jgi:hypothetical protein
MDTHCLDKRKRIVLIKIVFLLWVSAPDKVGIKWWGVYMMNEFRAISIHTMPVIIATYWFRNCSSGWA